MFYVITNLNTGAFSLRSGSELGEILLQNVITFPVNIEPIDMDDVEFLCSRVLNDDRDSVDGGIFSEKI